MNTVLRGLLVLLGSAFSYTAIAQIDLSVIAITQPVSGCALTASENVTIRLFNFGNTLPAGTSFNVAYSINGGPAVTELVVLGSNLLSNSTRNYSFTTQANLSVPGTYTFDATVNLAGDFNPTNNSFTGYAVTNTAPSVGGTISGPASVCSSTNSGVLTLSGQTGNVVRWEFSTDGGGSWVTLSNTTTTNSFTNVTVPTLYRAVVQNGSCSPAQSAVHSIAIDPASVGGTVNPAATAVCTGSNSGTLTLSGRTGNVVRWERSTDGGVTWNNIANTTTSQSFLNLTINTLYRALVQSGGCATAYSSIGTVNVNSPSGGGVISGPTQACFGGPDLTLTLSGYTGSITRWEYSDDGGGTWLNLVNTTATLVTAPSAGPRLYRARVQNSPCAATFSAIHTVSPGGTPVGGTVTGGTTVCPGANSGTLTLTSAQGTVQKWQSSTDGGLNWTDIPNTAFTQPYTNLTASTLFRAQVACGTSTFSGAALVRIDSRDGDGDGLTDTCDPDIDGDGVANNADNCPTRANANQLDYDLDGIGDICETGLGINTATPATPLHVRGGDAYLDQAGGSVIMKSPNGNCWKLTVANDGTLSVVAAPCP